MAFTTMAQVLAAMPGEHVMFMKSISAVSGGWASGWTAAGAPAAGVAPSSGLAGDVPTAATTGALPLVNPASGGLNLARFHTMMAAQSLAGMVMLYDRLWQNSGIDATSVAAQTINSVALTRPDALGKQVEAWWQVYGLMGAGTPNVTLTYTDQDGNTGNTGVSGTLATAMGSPRTGPFQLASGDTGVRSIQTWQADASFTSGTIGLVLRRRLAGVPFLTPPDVVDDVLRCALASIPNDACLEFIVFCNSGITIQVAGELFVVQG